MYEEWLRKSVTDKLSGSHVVKAMADELCSLLNVRPDDITPNEYFHVVATVLLEQLRERLLGQCRSGVLHDENEAEERFDYDRILQGLLAALERDLLESNMHMIRTLGGAIAERDSGTDDHNYRVTVYAVRLAEALNMSRRQIRSLIKGAFLHDVGKIGIPDAVLIKPSGLTDSERELMNSHVKRGGHIIKGVTWLEDALDVVLFHHERWDGSGYLAGLHGKSIPVNARIFMIGDVFDALTSRRPYKVPYTYTEAIDVIRTYSGTKFDPELVNVFIEIVADTYAELHELDAGHRNSVVRTFMRQYFDYDFGRRAPEHSATHDS